MKLLEFYFNTFLYKVWLPFCRVGFPLMLVTTVIAMFYLLICHVAFKWHPDWTYIIVLYTIYNRKQCMFKTYCVPPPPKKKKPFKNPLLSLTDFMCNGDFLHRYIFSWFFFFVIPQYSKCNAYYYVYYVIFMLWIQKWIVVFSSVDIFLFINHYITIKVTCIPDCDIILYISYLVYCVCFYF